MEARALVTIRLPERECLQLESAGAAVTVAGHPRGLALLGMHYVYLNTQREYLLVTGAELPAEQLGDAWQVVYLPPVAADTDVRSAMQQAGRAKQGSASAEAAPEPPAPRISRGQTISEAQRQRLWAIARNEGGFTETGVRRLLAEYRRHQRSGPPLAIESTEDVGRDIYEEVIERLRSPEEASRYNRDPYTQEMFQ